MTLQQVSKVEEICRRLDEHIQNPRTELNYLSDYTFLVAVVLSAQTTDIQVNRVTSTLFKKYKTIDDILDLGLEGFASEIRSIGLYRSKAKYIMKFSKILKEKYNSKVPNCREDLESLPGIGRKSANVVLNTLFNEPAVAVDTHVLRLSKRLGLSENSDPRKVEYDLEKIIPDIYREKISNLLILHGRYTCKARKPNCPCCVLSDLCDFPSLR
jgi:endonuclease-3